MAATAVKGRYMRVLMDSLGRIEHARHAKYEMTVMRAVGMCKAMAKEPGVYWIEVYGDGMELHYSRRFLVTTEIGTYGRTNRRVQELPDVA